MGVGRVNAKRRLPVSSWMFYSADSYKRRKSKTGRFNVKTLVVTQIAHDTWHIDEVGTNSMYLLAGKTSALLIDTACGFGDVSEIVQTLTSLPLLVACTHGHFDHVGGLGHFEEVYLHPKDIAMVRELKVFTFKLAAKLAGSKEKPRPISHALKFHVLNEGFSFDLGGRTVRTIELPGHTPGSVGFIDSATGFLFSGDACNRNLLLAFPFVLRLAMPPHMICESVETACNSLRKLDAMRSEYSANYTGHLHKIDCKPAPPETLEDCIACCEEILNGTAKQEKAVAATVFDKRNYRCASHGIVRITYNLKNLHG